MQYEVINLKGSESWMSDTFETLFTVAGEVFSSVYQYIVYCKARLNGRRDLIYTIKHTSNARDLYGIDREIDVLDKGYWLDICNDSKNIATIQKFSCNTELKEKLLQTDYNKHYKIVGGKLDFNTLRSVQSVMRMGD